MRTILRLAAMLVLFATAASSQTKGSWETTNLGGIHYAVLRSTLDPDKWQTDLQHTDDCQAPCIVSFDDRLSAVYLRFQWAQLNPAKGVYDFSELGSIIDIIQASGKMATLEVMAGKFTPAWVFDDGANHIKTRTKSAPDESQTLVPTPWDPVFLSAHKEMIAALSDFLHQTPSRYSTVVLVKNGGIAVHSGETRLMPPDAFVGGPETGDDKAKDAFRKNLCADWAQSGYSEGVIIQALRTLNKQISDAFPDKYIGLAFVEGSGEFPTVGANGKCTFPAKNETLHLLIKETVNTYGSRAVINSTVLSEVKGNPPILKWVLDNGGKIAFQLNRRTVGCKAGSDNPCDEGSFERTIQAGIDAGATYIEVHDGNINRFKAILPAMNATLAGR